MGHQRRGPRHDGGAGQSQGADEAPLAHGKRNVDKILPLARELYEQYSARIPTAELNKWLDGLKAQRAPSGRGNKTLKTFYVTQYGSSPPRFKVMVNAKALVTKSFAYYFENRLREEYNLWGIPLVIDFEGKEERYS